MTRFLAAILLILVLAGGALGVDVDPNHSIQVTAGPDNRDVICLDTQTDSLFGWVSSDTLLEKGDGSTWGRTVYDFNAAAGFTSADDRLPYFFKTEKLSPHDTVFDVPDEELDTVFNF